MKDGDQKYSKSVELGSYLGRADLQESSGHLANMAQKKGVREIVYLTVSSSDSLILSEGSSCQQNWKHSTPTD